MTQPEAIAAEVAARYGCPVMPGAVKIVPQGVSGLPYDVPGVAAPHWREQVNAQYRVLRAQQARGARLAAAAKKEAEETQRASRAALAASTGHAVKAPRRMPTYTTRDKTNGKADWPGIVERLASEGKCARQIADETGLSYGAVHKIANRVGFIIAPPPNVQRIAINSERDAAILAALAAGLSHREISEQFGVTTNVVEKVARKARDAKAKA